MGQNQGKGAAGADPTSPQHGAAAAAGAGAAGASDAAALASKGIRRMDPGVMRKIQKGGTNYNSQHAHSANTPNCEAAAAGCSRELTRVLRPSLLCVLSARRDSWCSNDWQIGAAPSSGGRRLCRAAHPHAQDPDRTCTPTRARTRPAARKRRTRGRERASHMRL